ncbi:MAG: hypothetical protein Rubg2KO_09160 [Rubricoccaceae bacterium]
MSRQLDVRYAVALAVGLGGLALGALLAAQDFRAGETPTAPPLELGASHPALLDTLAFRGRRIEASLSGWVSEVAPDGSVWLGSDALAFPVVLPDSVDAAVEDRWLVTGRLRGRGGTRWIQARTWTRVHRVAE